MLRKLILASVVPVVPAVAVVAGFWSLSATPTSTAATAEAKFVHDASPETTETVAWHSRYRGDRGYDEGCLDYG